VRADLVEPRCRAAPPRPARFTNSGRTAARPSSTSTGFGGLALAAEGRRFVDLDPILAQADGAGYPRSCPGRPRPGRTTRGRWSLSGRPTAIAVGCDDNCPGGWSRWVNGRYSFCCGNRKERPVAHGPYWISVKVEFRASLPPHSVRILSLRKSDFAATPRGCCDLSHKWGTICRGRGCNGNANR